AKEDIRAFAVEGDFDGAEVGGSDIVGAGGSGEVAINSLDFDIYTKEQMINLVEWMHDYNELVDIGDTVRYYDNDMQRYDEFKSSLLAYFELVDHEAAQNYEEKLKAATNDNLDDLTEAELKNIGESIVDIKDDLEKNADKYIETLSETMYETAL